MDPVTTLAGRCHCGNITVTLETGVPIERLPLSSDTCSFCRRHGARTTRDPQGRVRLTVREPDRLIRYRFGLRTADFLVCASCGIYVAAVMTDGERSYAVVNVNTFEEVDRFTQAVVPVGYDGETEAERRARRVRTWTPVAERPHLPPASFQAPS
jgi:hypothetical protein